MEVKMKKLWLAAVLAVLLGGVAQAKLARQVNAIIGRPSQSKVKFSIHIIKADSGKTVYKHNSTEALIPASNMKIITSAAALKYLGADFEYVTKVGLCGQTLVVIGSGDPLLGDAKTDETHGKDPGWIFEGIAAALKQNRIDSVKHLVVDSTVFDDQRVHPNWPKEDLNRWYACEVSGVNYNANCVDIGAKTLAGRAFIVIEPRTSFLKIINEVTATSSGKSVIGAYRNQQPNTVIVKGKCAKEIAPFPFAIERPAAFFGYLLAEQLLRSQIELEGELIEKPLDPDCELIVLREYRHSLGECLARCNKNSFGLAAEAFVKTIGAKATHNGKNGSWEKGGTIISRYLSALGIGRDEFHLDDGSGLSRANKLSARAITRVLADVYKSGDWALYKDSLAVGGVDGTMKKHFKEDRYKGKVFGKTGYIRGVKSLSGLCSSSTGDYIFSILTNNASAKTRPAINDIAKAILGSK
jgi:D-alanyl-D-alanine carboxypeptidase/D-alanyl-D-alanine-endopeptidase (penicillin-binding protein 4)